MLARSDEWRLFPAVAFRGLSDPLVYHWDGRTIAVTAAASAGIGRSPGNHG
jgi:hypothetical protein